MGVTERRQREKDKRRADIVDAAEALFFAKGFSTTTMDGVAAAAELSKGTLYLYFESKEDLLHAIIIRGILILQSMFEEAAASEGRGIDQIEAIGRAYFRFCHEYPNYFNAMLQFEAGAPGAERTGYGADCVEQSDRTFAICAAAVQQGIDDGSIRADVDPMKTALTLYGLSTGLLQVISIKGEMMRDSHEIDPAELIETFFELIYKSLRA